MPLGTPFTSHIPPYTSIRIDGFTSPIRGTDLHLLTHTHTDHTRGLENKAFGLGVVCSADGRGMLLGIRGVRGSRKFGHLEGKLKLTVGGGKRGEVVDRKLIRTIPLNTPTTFPLPSPPQTEVTITAIDANHCPGSVMYLVEGPLGAVLHTGDVRAEAWWVESLRRHPALVPYIQGGGGGGKQLEAIYLDTACFGFDIDVPAKADAMESTLDVMALYPADFKFFINDWTAGYEDLLVGIAMRFGTKIHVGKHKYEQYTSLPSSLGALFKKILTVDNTSDTRFHACGPRRCSAVSAGEGIWAVKEGVAFVQPKDMGLVKWGVYVDEARQRIGCADYPQLLHFAISRHSPLPELKTLVGLFRPKTVVPNVLDPRTEGRDWASIPHAFRDELPEDAKYRIWKEMRENGVGLALGDDARLEELGVPRKGDFSEVADGEHVREIGYVRDDEDEEEGSTDEEKGLREHEEEESPEEEVAVVSEKEMPQPPTPLLPPTPPMERQATTIPPPRFLFTMPNPSEDSLDVESPVMPTAMTTGGRESGRAIGSEKESEPETDLVEGAVPRPLAATSGQVARVTEKPPPGTAPKQTPTPSSLILSLKSPRPLPPPPTESPKDRQRRITAVLSGMLGVQPRKRRRVE